MDYGEGLEPRSVATYVKEWESYLHFCARAGVKRVPGRDVPWRIQELRKYLWWRATTNNVRSIAQIKSKLKHCSSCWGHLLPTLPHEAPANLRLQIYRVCRDIGKKQKAALAKRGLSAGKRQSLALGRVAVGLLFSAYGAATEEGFNALSRRLRHMLAMCAAMHTGCMRFELLRQIRKKGHFRWSQPDECWRVSSDWHKMKRRQGEFSVDFLQRPRHAAMFYAAYTEAGSVQHAFTAADVLRWHMRRVGSRAGADVFEPVAGKNLSSAEFQVWLRSSFRALLMEDSREVAAIVAGITPHSFRAGMASDLEHENVSRQRMKRVGRWDSDKAMEDYIRPRLAQRLRRLQFRVIKRDRRRATARASTAPCASLEDSSEGYDTSGGEGE